MTFSSIIGCKVFLPTFGTTFVITWPSRCNIPNTIVLFPVVAASHALCSSADVCFIALNLTRQRKLAVHFRHVLTDLMADTKREFGSHAKLTLQFFSRIAMTRRGEQIHGIEPKRQWRPAVFKQRSDSRVKTMAATLARISALRFEPAMPFGFVFALRARIVLAETNFKKVIQAGFIVAKLRENSLTVMLSLSQLFLFFMPSIYD